MFAIIDIETTGSNTKSDKITEIAIYKHDGKTIIEEFSTLINPERRIPFFISELTGINNEMVENAPKFYEVAKSIIEITEGSIFVAHNVGFDYNFIRTEFKSLGYEFKRQKLCTVKLSRHLIPGLSSYSLGKLCRNLSIDIENRHRAKGDAHATVKLFEHLLDKDKSGKILSNSNSFHLPGLLNSNLPQEVLDQLPSETGIYYFLNQHNEIIYIGKSKNIRSRVLAHLNNFDNKKAMELRDNIYHVNYTITGSDLISQLLESAEIKKHRPFFNRKQLKAGSDYSISSHLMLDGFIHLKAGKTNKSNGSALAYFGSIDQAKGFLNQLSDQFNLCPKLIGTETSSVPCTHFLNLKCDGHCDDLGAQEEHNLKVKEAIDHLAFEHDNFLIIDKGRAEDEKAVVCIEQGRYQGYGFFKKSPGADEIEKFKSCIMKDPGNYESRQIIKGYLKRSSVEAIIPY